ncbi:hypothetical protein [Limnobacter parvus]|uniref:Peptidase C39-like domain-containing protein n=1 Tax=Limnobacter parvus TaxID=2939690 RepID=A0ABT1XDD8_9BURK|nr:hypothetical protein [Limnobacter parvus]MCR2745297.1 hypothetical protein [Limnobacter parvus]
MNENKAFEIDFTEAKNIASLPERVYPITQNEIVRLENIWGFAAPNKNNSFSGPCALGTVLHFHSIGWSHLPKERNGRPVNDPYIEELIRWSQAPGTLAGDMGTTPGMMLASLRKAGLRAQWYSGSSVEKTLQLIKYEIGQGRPVIVLVNHRQVGQPVSVEWQVVFKTSSTGIYTKYCSYADAEKAWTFEEFSRCLQMEMEALSCCVITAEKD